jgi:HSP20 family protein
MALVRWDPFRELTSLQGEVNRMLRRFGDSGEVGHESWMPSLDVIETKDGIELKADLAGMKPEDIQLEVEENVLTLRGERRFEEKVEEDKYYRIERRFGSFSRSIGLPQNVDSEAIEANYENGVLHVRVPKVEQAKPKRISVSSVKDQPATVEANATEKTE